MAKTQMPSVKDSGVFFALIAFIFWGLYPFYWKELDTVDPIEIVAHRVIWIIPICLGFMAFKGSLYQLHIIFKSPKLLLFLAASTFFISINWGLYIWAVSTDQILQASLGYFMNPLANVVAGLIIFKEKLRKWQWVSVTLAAIGVVASIAFAGIFPLVGVILAVSFAIYGSVRKFISVDAVTGMCMEALLLLPVAVGYLVWLFQFGELSFLHGSFVQDGLLFGAGIVTALPLLAYVAASKRLPISTLGILFYLVPSCLFLVATIAYDEVVTLGDMITFSFIWLSLIIFTLERRFHARRNRQVVA